MKTKPLQIALLTASAAMFCGAGALWASKNRVVAQREQARQQIEADNEFYALNLLKRSTQADNTRTYSALSETVAFMGGKSVSSLSKITRAPQSLTLETLSGSGKGERNGYSQKWFWRQSAGGKVLPYAEVSVPAEQMATRRLALLAENYRVSLGASKKIAGRQTRAIELRPKRVIDGAQGPARRLWIDEGSGLTLGIESYNCNLKPISRSTLSEIKTAPLLSPRTFEPPQAIFASLDTRNWQGEELGADFRAASQKTGVVPPKPTYLPPGFALEGYGVHRCLTTGTLQPAAFTRYCDGLNTLTIFAFKPVNADILQTMRGNCNFGPGALTSREVGEGRLVALGDLPPQTLKRVLDSAQFEMAR